MNAVIAEILLVAMVVAMPCIVVMEVTQGWNGQAAVGSKRVGLGAMMQDPCDITVEVPDTYNQTTDTWTYKRVPAYPQIARCQVAGPKGPASNETALVGGGNSSVPPPRPGGLVGGKP